MTKTLSIFILFTALLGISPSTLATAQETIEGYWEGIIAQQGKELRFNVEFERQADGMTATIGIPDLYIFGHKLAKVSYEAPKVHFELPLGREPEKFDGTLQDRNISGSYVGRFYKEESRSAVMRLWRETRKPTPYKQEEVNFYNGQVRLAGTLFVPIKKGPHPAVVFFHGSGPQTRESYLRFFADLFARHGFATLIFDKRGTGASTGEVWYRTGDRFDNLAADALSGVRFLQSRSDINPRKIGFWGLSQGGWLAPLAASRSKGVAFLMVVSGGGVTPAEQEVYDDEVKLQDKGYSQEQVAEAVALLRLADDVIRGRESWEKFEVARALAQKKDWFALLDRYPVKLPKEDDTWRAGSEGMDFDPRPLWEKTTIPVLAIYGEADKSTPTQESVRRVEASLRKAGNKTYTIKTFPKADHALWISAKGTDGWDWDRPASGWLDLMVNWLQKHGK
jgi:pimeloyl-ACP methyl ester carboxylesterase